MKDLIDRQAAIDAIDAILPVEPMKNEYTQGITCGAALAIEYVKQLPSAQPFHNITMGEVLKYIDDMPEDVWQEFTACLECRGWELQKRTAKWCGGDFA